MGILTTLIIAAVIFLLSAGGMFYLTFRRFKEARVMADEDLFSKLRELRPVFSDFHDFVFVPAANFWQTKIFPALCKESEKIVSRFRINVLKIECELLKLTNYLRGKRTMNGNGNGTCEQSEYWKEVNDFKNGLNENEEKKKE